MITEGEKQNFMQDVEFYQKKLKTLMEQYAQIKKESEGKDDMSDKLSDVAWEIQIKKEGLEYSMKMLVDSQN